MFHNNFEEHLKNIKNRPLVIFSAFLASGIMTSSLLDSGLLSVISVLCLIILTAAINKNERISILAVGICLSYTIGVSQFTYINFNNTNEFKEFYEKNVVLTGFIASEPDIKEIKANYTVKVTKIEYEGLTRNIKGKVLLSTMANKIGSSYEYGQDVRISGKLKSPKGVRNPGGFDYRRYLAQSGIGATMFALEHNISSGEVRQPNRVVRTGLIIRSRLVQTISRSLPAEQAGLLNGMLIGYRQGLTKQVQDAFSDAGLTHIMAVSGANIAFIIFPLLFLFKRLRLSQRLSNILIILVLVLFVFITGFSPSVVRAVIMAIVLLLGQILYRETDVYTSLAFSAIIMLLYNPYTLFDIGFQLSFAATLSLVFFYRRIKALLSFKYMPEFLADVLACTLAAQIGVLPITAYYFNKISIISIITNIIVVPVTQIITIIGFIMVFAGQVSIVLSKIIGLINLPFLTLILYTAKISAGVPFATIRVVTPQILVIFSYYLLIFFFLWFKPLINTKLHIGYYIAAIGTVILVFMFSTMLPRDLEVVFIDVGQGDSALIRTSAGKTVLIDGGGNESEDDSRPDIGETIVIPFLLDYGVSKLDIVAATHGHNDHVQGLLPILESFKTDNLIIPDTNTEEGLEKILKIANDRGIPVRKCNRGDAIKLDNSTVIEVLHPEKGFAPAKAYLNNCSLVLKLNYGKTSILFTGDIEEQAETLLINDKIDIKADVLKVPHHGSSSSSGIGFIDSVSPMAAIINVGSNNFGHPSFEVIDRLRQKGAEIFRTDRDGAVLLSSNGKEIKIRRTVVEKK